MGKVVNLNRFRKQKAKTDRSKQAEINRRLHGRTKAERAREELQKQQLTRQVDAAKLGEPVALAPDDADSDANDTPDGDEDTADTAGRDTDAD
jgi:hypothetical protein